MKTGIKLIFLISISYSLILGCGKEKTKNILAFKIDKDFKLDYQHQNYFNDLVWKDSLTETDLNTIDKAFYLPSFNPKGEGRIINHERLILVNRINLPLNRDTSFYWERFNEYLNKSKKLDDKEYDEFLYRQINHQELFGHLKYSHAGPSKSDIFLDAIIIRQIKMLRKRKSPNIIIQDSLNRDYKYHMRYSKFPEKEATDSLIIKILDNSKDSQYVAYQSLDVLKTYNNYNNETVETFSNLLMDTTQIKKISERGKERIFKYLSEKIKGNLPQNEANKLMQFLNTKEVFEKHYHYHRYSISYLNLLILGKEESERLVEYLNPDTLLVKKKN